MADYQEICGALEDGLVQSLEPLIRAAQVLELQEVEKRLETLGHRRANLHFDGDNDAQGIDETIDRLWKRRGELLVALWGRFGIPREDARPTARDLEGGSRGRP